MRKEIKCFILVFNYFRFLPHVVVFILHRNKNKIESDTKQWLSLLNVKTTKYIYGLIYLLSFYPEYRNVFYHRIGFWGKLLNVVCRKMSTLYIQTPEKETGEGLFIQHGFATIIAAKSIGKNAWINQQVTIGYSNKTDCPVLGDNVTVNAGAKVIGDVIIGNNSKVGANAVVVKNVPDNCTVVGVPAYIIKRDGIKVKENL